MMAMHGDDGGVVYLRKKILKVPNVTYFIQ